MAYYNEDQLRRYFEKAIKRESEQQIHKLQKEIDYIYSREIKKITEEIEIKKQVQMAKELKEVHIAYQEEINQIGIGYDEKLILKRREMTASIFDEIEERMRAFVKTDAYQTWLINKLTSHKSYIQKHEIKIYVSPGDETVKKVIQQTFNQTTCQCEAIKDIHFGGFILVIPKLMIEIDETLDARLIEQKEWFLNHSKLFIRR